MGNLDSDGYFLRYDDKRDRKVLRYFWRLLVKKKSMTLAREIESNLMKHGDGRPLPLPPSGPGSYGPVPPRSEPRCLSGVIAAFLGLVLFFMVFMQVLVFNDRFNGIEKTLRNLPAPVSYSMSDALDIVFKQCQHVCAMKDAPSSMDFGNDSKDRAGENSYSALYCECEKK